MVLKIICVTGGFFFQARVLDAMAIGLSRRRSLIQRAPGQNVDDGGNILYSTNVSGSITQLIPISTENPASSTFADPTEASESQASTSDFGFETLQHTPAPASATSLPSQETGAASTIEDEDVFETTTTTTSNSVPQTTITSTRYLTTMTIGTTTETDTISTSSSKSTSLFAGGSFETGIPTHSAPTLHSSRTSAQFQYSTGASSSGGYGYASKPTYIPDETDNTSPSSSVSTGAKAGIAISAVAVIASLCMLVYLLRRRKRRPDEVVEDHSMPRELGPGSAQPPHSTSEGKKAPKTFKELLGKKDGKYLQDRKAGEGITKPLETQNSARNVTELAELPGLSEKNTQIVSKLPASISSRKRPPEHPKPPQSYKPYRPPPIELSSTPGPEKQQQRIESGRALHHGVPQRSERPKGGRNRTDQRGFDGGDEKDCEELDSTPLHEAPSGPLSPKPSFPSHRPSTDG